MKIGLLNPSPLGASLTLWGDYQFGRSLEQALLRRGVEVEQRFWPQWDELGPVDLCVTLRGKRAHPPRAGQCNALWIISHPASVSAAEMEGYDVIFTASQTHKDQIEGSVGCPVHVLRQCTDVSLFSVARTPAEDFAIRRDALFVANSRGIRRPIIANLSAIDFPFVIIGRHWREVGLFGQVRSAFVPNDELPRVYADCRLALNDHWVDMKHFGFINNRIFDCLAAGTPILTDSFPELREVCGDQLLYGDDTASCRQAVTRYLLEYPAVLRDIKDLWARIGPEYTFDRRAEQILAAANDLKPRAARPRGAGDETPLTKRVLRGLTDLRTGLGIEQLQVLHLFPQRSLQHSLAGRADLDYVTAGLGVGPWLVDLSNGLSSLPVGRFHCAILDRGTPPSMDIAQFMAPGAEIFKID